ncbi:MAG: lmo0937 family membrane protein [Lentimicrobium sp.]|nr:lmo0937 family membrane protein [Lentimicrobium sp.]MDD2526636.1 lmo0937 family membrane protein [Lentimicrobiaceae bacterium]MDD4596820.1 lmo0937 family membrane protein [Lentimicrobiaceae bacterium]MDY0025321.1 lmo0937 family membrane protein [Lentimicrobium sp.]HAH60341.1 lmo0937 family membrane protein [Bacteroidales bacterium]
MRSLLYVIAVVLIIGWILGFFVFAASSLIHILLVFALISIIISLLRG